jgi:hypothetical protein
LELINKTKGRSRSENKKIQNCFPAGDPHSIRDWVSSVKPVEYIFVIPKETRIK